jgi:hypothetical protein
MGGWVIKSPRKRRSRLSLYENKNAVVNIFLPTTNVVAGKNKPGFKQNICVETFF